MQRLPLAPPQSSPDCSLERLNTQTTEELEQQAAAAAARHVKAAAEAAAVVVCGSKAVVEGCSDAGQQQRRRISMDLLRQQALQRRASVAADKSIPATVHSGPEQSSDHEGRQAAAPKTIAKLPMSPQPLVPPVEPPSAPEPPLLPALPLSLPHTRVQQLQQQPDVGDDQLAQLIQRAEQLKQSMGHAALGTAPQLLVTLPSGPEPARPHPPSVAVDSSQLAVATTALLQAARALQQVAGNTGPASGTPAAGRALPLLPSSLAMASAKSGERGRSSNRSNSLEFLSDSESDPADLAADVILQDYFDGDTGSQEQAVKQQSAETTDLQQRPASPELSTLVLSVRLSELRLAASAGQQGSVRCVVKALGLCRSGAGEQQQATLALEGAAAATSVEVDLPVPAPSDTAAQQQVLLPPYLFCELWTHGGRLLGLVQAPLLPPPPGGPPAVASAGQQQVWDPLEGAEAGSLHVAAVIKVCVTEVWVMQHFSVLPAMPSPTLPAAPHLPLQHPLPRHLRSVARHRWPSACAISSQCLCARRSACLRLRPMPRPGCLRPMPALFGTPFPASPQRCALARCRRWAIRPSRPAPVTS